VDQDEERQFRTPGLLEQLRARNGGLIRWTVATAGLVSMGHATFEEPVKDWPQEQFTLRQGMMLVRGQPQRNK